MLNTSDFAIRLQQVMDYYGLNAAAFADSLEIQRSGVSHLLSERNKPSLDFILKLIEKFPEVDMYWITQDKELASAKKTQQPDLFSDIPEIEMQASTPAPPSVAIKEKQVETKALPLPTDKHIKRIIFFYEDNRFEVFEN